MLIVNKTHYSTASFRKILDKICAIDDCKPPRGIRVCLVYARARGSSGRANLRMRNSICRKDGAFAMLMRVPKAPLSEHQQTMFIAVVRHEVGHWRGLLHTDMGGALLDPHLFKRETNPWTDGLALELAPETPKTTAPKKDVVGERAAHARAMLDKHTKKLAREKVLVAKWTKKVRYYDKKTES